MFYKMLVLGGGLLFKKRVPVAEYYDSKLKQIFSDEQTQSWMVVLKNSDDEVFRAANQQAFVEEMRGAYLQLLGVAIVTKYNDVWMYSLACSHEEMFLKETGNEQLETIKLAYNAAFGSSPVDGVVEMMRLLNSRVCSGKLSEGSIELLTSEMYRFLGGIYRDFKSIKLTTE